MLLSFNKSLLVIHRQTFFPQGCVPGRPSNVFNSCFSTSAFGSQGHLDITHFGANGFRAWQLELCVSSGKISVGDRNSHISSHFSTKEHILEVLLRADYTSESLWFSFTYAQAPIPEILINGFGVEPGKVHCFPNSVGDQCIARRRAIPLQKKRLIVVNNFCMLAMCQVLG